VTAGRPLSRRERLALACLLPVGRTAVRLLGATLRVSEAHREIVEPLWATGSPIVYVVWHGRMFLIPYLYGRHRTVHVLASRSRDGEIIARFAHGFGFRVLRGSTSRGASTALRALARLLRDERAEVAIIPDGPRGPRYVAQPGAVLLAKLGRAPIVPVGLGAAPATRLSSWDEFLLPHPFARLVVAFGEPLAVPADADHEALERGRRELEAALIRVTREADRLAERMRASGRRGAGAPPSGARGPGGRE
jgi:lysophospholipid acyltransferase (LPLAT)-like uncharacterized protein